MVAVVGLAQGLILGHAIIERLPRLQYHAKWVSMFLFAIFVAHAIVSTMHFTYPDKVNLAQLLTATPERLVSVIPKIMGLGVDIYAILGFIVMIFALLILRLTGVKGYSRYFILAINTVMLVIMFAVKFSYYQPSSFEIILFVLYHAGLTGGLLWGTTRKLYSDELRMRNFVDLWIGKKEFL